MQVLVQVLVQADQHATLFARLGQVQGDFGGPVHAASQQRAAAFD